eukprot:1080373-Rhodomonas_salina.1
MRWVWGSGEDVGGCWGGTGGVVLHVAVVAVVEPGELEAACCQALRNLRHMPAHRSQHLSTCTDLHTCSVARLYQGASERRRLLQARCAMAFEATTAEGPASKTQRQARKKNPAIRQREADLALGLVSPEDDADADATLLRRAAALDQDLKVGAPIRRQRRRNQRRDCRVLGADAPNLAHEHYSKLIPRDALDE